MPNGPFTRRQARQPIRPQHVNELQAALENTPTLAEVPDTVALEAAIARADPVTPLVKPGGVIGTKNGTTISELIPGRIDAAMRGVVGDGSGDKTAAIQSLINEAKPLRQQVFLGDGIFPTDGLSISFEGDAATSGTFGFRAPPLAGTGPRSTILTHRAGSMVPLIRVRGSEALGGTSHASKVLGAVVEGMELRGQGIASGNPTVLIELSVFQYLAMRDIYVTEGGGDAVHLKRPVKTSIRDDHSHIAEFENMKIFRNAGDGVRTPDDHAVGPVVFVNVESSYNGGDGFDLISSGITLLSCATYGNTGGGLKSRTVVGASISIASGLSLIASRFEGDGGVEVDLQGGSNPLLLNTTIYSTAAAGADCLVIGNSGNEVRNAVVIGGSIVGNGGAAGTAGQKAIRLGAGSVAARIENPYVIPAQFNDAYTSADPMSAVSIHASAVDPVIMLAGRNRHREYTSLPTGSVAASTLIYQARVFGDTANRLEIFGTGEYRMGDGTTAPDTKFSRGGANILAVGSGDTLLTESTWNAGLFRIGTTRLWRDATGNLRGKNGVPASETDGTIIVPA